MTPYNKNMLKITDKRKVAPRPGFGPGSGHELVRDVLRATAAYTRPNYTTWAFY